MRTIRQLDGISSEFNVYLSCSCGYPVWRMEMESYDAARSAINRGAIPWRRQQKLKAAGGKHTRDEIREIIIIQEGRCIYCDAKFTDKNRPSKDHLLSLTDGGSDWALNIVLACRGCNSRRGNIPFRTFCKLLSPTQNKRVLMHLRRRLLALEVRRISADAFACLVRGLAMHDPKHYRYLDIQRMRATARQNVRVNRLLPRNLVSILRSTSASPKSPFTAKFDRDHS